MATAAGVISRSTWQGLLRQAVRPSARSRLLVRKPRWISSGEQARSNQVSSARAGAVRPRHQWLLTEFGEPFKTIDQKSFKPFKGPVRLVDSEIECLCSWNEASGPRQAIYVPGDASRPRKAGSSLSNNVIHEPIDPSAGLLNRSWGYCNPGRGPRSAAWDDPLASLCATDPELKLHDIDVMISVEMLIYLLAVALNSKQGLQSGRMCGTALNMSLIGNTLVIKRRPREQASGDIQIPSMVQSDWGYFKASTESVPEVEDSSLHYQLLRYNMGPLSCLVRSKVNGTVQEMPTSTSSSERPRVCEIHDVDVVKAGKGVLMSAAFVANYRLPPRKRSDEFMRLIRHAPRLWFSGQTKLGLGDKLPVEQSVGDLTVVEMGELARQFEDRNQRGLRRLVGLLMTLRAVVRAHGAPCVGVFWPRAQDSESADDRPDHILDVHSAGPEEAPVLLDWHKKHFWSLNRARSEHSRRRVKPGNWHPRSRVEPSNRHPQPQKSIIGKLAKWLGF